MWGGRLRAEVRPWVEVRSGMLGTLGWTSPSPRATRPGYPCCPSALDGVWSPQGGVTNLLALPTGGVGRFRRRRCVFVYEYVLQR